MPSETLRNFRANPRAKARGLRTEISGELKNLHSRFLVSQKRFAFLRMLKNAPHFSAGVFDRSCGIVLFRRDKKIRYLLLHYEAGHWDFVKGNIEKNEKEKQTVIREVKEETGIESIEFVEGFKKKLHYFYKKSNKTIYKEVIFFLAETKERAVNLSFEHIGFKWLDYNDALKLLTFENAKDILKKANCKVLKIRA